MSDTAVFTEDVGEAKAMAGLAVKHYPGKMKQAKRLAETHHTELPYWGRVRLLYLELGGLYIRQLKPKQQASYFQGGFTA